MVLRVTLNAECEQLDDQTWCARYPHLETTGRGTTPKEAAIDLATQHAERLEAEDAYRETVDAMMADPPPEWPVDYLTPAEFQEMYRKHIQGEVIDDDHTDRRQASWQKWRVATAAVASEVGRSDLVEGAHRGDLQAALRSLIAHEPLLAEKVCEQALSADRE